MDAAERHVLDAVPVGLQMWEAAGDAALTLRYANDEAQRSGAARATPSALRRAACLAQEPLTLELADGARATWWRVQVTPLGDALDPRRLLGHHGAEGARAQSLRASEQLNREILSGLQEGVVVVDTDARVVVANEAAAELFGVPLDELMDRPLSAHPGRPARRARAPAGRPTGCRWCARCAARRSPGMVVRFVRRDGSLLWVEVHANPLHDDDGALYGAVASYDDVTARVEQDRRTRHEADTDALTGLGEPARAGADAGGGAGAGGRARRARSAW